MMRNQSGFTLIELVIVIIVLGILSAVAIPNFVDLRQEARQGRIEGVSGALASASVINYTQCIAPNSAGATGVVVNDCSDLAALISGVAVGASTTPTAGTFGLDSTEALADGVASNCTLYDGDDNTLTTTFPGIGTPAACL